MITKATLDQLVSDVHATKGGIRENTLQKPQLEHSPRLNSCYAESCMSFKVVGPSSAHAINDVGKNGVQRVLCKSTSQKKGKSG